MRKLAMVTSILALSTRCFLAAHAFTFSGIEVLPEVHLRSFVAQVATENDKDPSSQIKNFRDLSAQCTEDILIFADGKTLCGELVDMPPIVNDDQSKPVEISEVSAIIFESEKDPNMVHHVLRNGNTIATPLSKDSFRFSVEYIENAGEQRVQVFYVSPKDIRYIIISPRLPKTPPGIRPSNTSGQSDGMGVLKRPSSSRVTEAAELAALWYYDDSHTLLSEATAAVVLPSDVIMAVHNTVFSDIVSYYAQLGAPEDDFVDSPHVVFGDQQSSQETHGLLFGPKAFLTASTAFESFNELVFEEGQNPLNEINTLASAEASAFSTEFSLDDHQMNHLFVMEFDLQFNEDEEAEESDDFGLSGIKYMVDNDAPSKDPLIAHANAHEYIAFSTNSQQWFENKHQCTQRCESPDWPPVKKELSKNEMVRLGDEAYIASSPVSNKDYQVFVEVTKHNPPSHWTGGNYPEMEATDPVVNVTYQDAVAYVEWSEARLPSHEELMKASNSLDSVPKEFREWTSTCSMVDCECFKLYHQKSSELLLWPSQYPGPHLGFRCVKDVE